MTLINWILHAPSTSFRRRLQHGQARSVKALLAAKADPNQRARTGGTALMFAAYADKPELARLLLDNGASPNAKGANDGTALIVASQFGRVL